MPARRPRRSGRARNAASIVRQTASHAASPTLRVNAAVGDDLDVAVGEQQVDEHAAVLLGVPDPQQPEHLERALARRHAAQHARERQRRLDDEAHLPAMTPFARRRSPPRCARAPPRETRAARAVVGREVAQEARQGLSARHRSSILRSPVPRRAAAAEAAAAAREAATAENRRHPPPPQPPPADRTPPSAAPRPPPPPPKKIITTKRDDRRDDRDRRASRRRATRRRRRCRRRRSSRAACRRSRAGCRRRSARR